MRIPSGKTDQVIYFVAVDSVDLKTRETGLTTFTVYRSRNGGAATAYTTPTVAELSAANMPGVYSLLIDEDTTIASGSDSEEYVVHITQAAMAPVTRTIELYRRDTTSGQTLTVTSGRGNADLTHIATAAVNTASAQLGVNVVNAAGTAWNSGAIGASTLAADTITAAKIAADAIGASELAADAVAEIADAVWDEDATAHQTQGTFGQAIGDPVADTNTIYKAVVTDATGATVGADVVAVQADTDNIQTRLPAALVSGRMDSSVGAMATDVLTSTALAASAVTEIQTGLSTLDAAGVRSAVGLASANLDTQLDALPTAAENATALLASAVEGAITVLQSLRLANAALGGKASGLDTTTAVFRDLADSKDRITATVDANGNRSAVTRDLT